MQKLHPSFTPLNTHTNTLTAPSSFFTLEPVLPSAASKANKHPSTTQSVADPSAGGVQSIMATRRFYDCFDVYGKGHLHSVDTLFDKGVWIGYLAEESRNTRYRHLPSFRELEGNHKNLTRPFPTPLPDSSCSDHDAVCRGCFDDRSTILQLREIRFGPHSKVMILPLHGADDAGLFCILLPQTLDRSIKALESFRLFEHGLDRDENTSFTNDYMLLAIRDRKNNSGVLHTVRTTLDPAELSMIANRPRRQRSDSGPNDQSDPKPTVEKTPQSGVLPKIAKRKKQHTLGEASEPGNLAKRSRPVSLKGPRMSASIMQISDDDMAEPLRIPNARSSMSRVRMEQRTPMRPSDLAKGSPTQTPVIQNVPYNVVDGVSKSFFTDAQARQICLIWKFEYKGMEGELMRTLHAARTFQGVLDAFRSETRSISSAARLLNTDLWALSYKLADGTGKMVMIKLTNTDFELNFDRLLRGLSEQEGWKGAPGVFVEILLSEVNDGP